MTEMINHYTNNFAAFAMFVSADKKTEEKLLGEINGIITAAGLAPNLEIKDIGYKILSSKQKTVKKPVSANLDIRFSSINKLNDSSEFEYGKSRIIDALNQIPIISEDVRELVDCSIKILSDEKLIRILKDNTYILSFSSLKNNLNQWRLYGEDGSGVCLGIDLTEIESIYQTHIFSSVSPVKYKTEEVQKFIESLIQDDYTFPPSYKKDYKDIILNGNDFREVTKSAFLFRFLSAILSIKHDSFSDEREVRLVYNPIFANFIDHYRINSLSNINEFIEAFSDKIQCFDIKNGKIYYYKLLPIQKTSLREVWLGPKNPNSIDIFRRYLEYNGFFNVKIEKSNLPYR